MMSNIYYLLQVYYEAIRDALEIQYPITLSANEIEKIFEFNDNFDSPCSLPDIASGLSKIGFPEMEEQINAIGHPDIVVDEKTKKRGDCIFHCHSVRVLQENVAYCGIAWGTAARYHIYCKN